MILENYRQTTDCKSQTVKETSKQNNHSDEGEREFLTTRKAVKMRPLNNIPQFASPNRFGTLRMTTDYNDKESDEQLTRATTAGILGDSIVKSVYGNVITKSIKHKKHVVVKHFSGAKNEDMKHYVKPRKKNNLYK